MSVGHWPSIIRTPSLSANRQSVAPSQLIRKPRTSRKYSALLFMSGTASTNAQGAIFDCMVALARLTGVSCRNAPVRSTNVGWVMTDKAQSEHSRVQSDQHIFWQGMLSLTAEP